MKTAWAFVLLFTPSLFGNVTFNCTPTAISNSYQGVITLQINGLTDGESVLVQKFLDINSNGVVDAGDLLVQQFALTDGKAFVISGVTNTSVPGDVTGLDGAITAPLSVVVEGNAQQWVGQFLWVLSSTNGAFVPITNAFLVTNSAFSQKISGIVQCNGTNVPNAVVTVGYYGGSSDLRLVNGVVANGSGGFSVTELPGSYQLYATAPGCLNALTNVPIVTLFSGATVSSNVTLYPATETISGQVVAAASTSFGLGGLLMASKSTNGLIGFGTTDSNGNFSMPATAGGWGVSMESQGIDAIGYLNLENNTTFDASGGSVSGVVVALPRATALFYGSVMDSHSKPLVGVRLEGDNGQSGGQYQGDATSDQNGRYVMGAVAGNWDVGTDAGSSGPLYSNYLFSTSAFSYNGGGDGTNLVAGSVVEQDFLGVEGIYQITGSVLDTNNNPIVGVGVNASAVIDGQMFQTQNSDTDVKGKYTLAVGPGQWTVSVNCCDCNGDSLSALYQCPNSQTVTVSSGTATAPFVVIENSTDQITGYVTNAQGDGVAGVTVAADGSQGGNNFTTTTAGDGSFTLIVIDDAYNVGVDCAQLNALDYQCVPTDYVVLYETNGVADFGVQKLPADVREYAVYQREAFVQTAAGTVTADTNQGFEGSIVIDEANTNTVVSASVTLPGGPVEDFAFGSQFSDQELTSNYTSLPALQAGLPNGTYVFDILCAHDGAKSLPLTLSAGTFPNAPQISDFAATQAVSATNSLLLQWNSFSGGRVSDFIRLSITSASGKDAYTSPDIDMANSWNGTVTSVLIPAYQLQPGQTYQGELTFIRTVEVDTNSYPGSIGIAAYVASTTFNLVTTNLVNLPQTIPAILSQPQSETVLAGQTASFTAIVEGYPSPTLQWMQNNAPVAGANGPTLTLSNVQLTNEGTYTVVASNTAGTAKSVGAVLTVTPTSTVSPPGLGVVLTGGRTSFQFTFGGLAGQQYLVEESSNLVNWTTVLTTNLVSSTFEFASGAPTNRSQFFRIYQEGAPVSINTEGSAIIFASESYSANAGSGEITIPVTRTQGLSNAVCVNYEAGGGTGVAGVDYTAVSGTLCLASNVASNSFTVPVLSGGTNGQDVTVDLNLSSTNSTNQTVTLHSILTIHKPRPVAEIQYGQMVLVVPTNCPETVSIANTGPTGSVLNFTVADTGGYLNVSLGAPVPGYETSSITGSLKAGEQVQLDVTVQEGLADSLSDFEVDPTLGWPIVTTSLAVYTPNAVNAHTTSVSVPIYSELGSFYSGISTCVNFVNISGNVYYQSCDADNDVYPLAGAVISTDVGDGSAVSDGNGYFNLIEATSESPSYLCCQPYSVYVDSDAFPDQDAGGYYVWGENPSGQEFMFYEECDSARTASGGGTNGISVRRVKAGK